ncbi:TlpA disulfide reductase family protein [Pseudoruegeria sp. SK021]|uniref:TlpA family protein disulfide reductase n=1 Tax=Pseudoruegeria sp. SK021 TaxID=1933035 RepID=UPI000A249043|nr:TlpA disulfide reductase family protein [Pseudoruegeria sp. SK021]OSP55652.1 thioredoxin [Pseudoruegeria sp. SK021]
MRRLALACLLALTPVAAVAGPDIAAIEALRDGGMKKLVFAADPQPVSDIAFSDLDGSTHYLSDFAGKLVVLNFWATWCAPCKKEMPSLDRLQAELGGDTLQVVTIATGRNSPAGINRFFQEEGVSNLPTYIDPKQTLARDMAVLALPITVLIDKEGREIARLRGEADWDTDSALAILSALSAADS